MVKVRMNTADVAAEVKCLRRLIGMRCANVYDISPKTYLFKLMNSSGVTESGESEKVLLLMESGVRLHTTAYVRDKNTTPSGFTLKLRKHIRSRRLEDIRQLGYDRIILFQFGLGSSAYYVILELYAQGNILLTDSEFTVLTLLRSHRDDDKGLAIMSQHRYPIEACRVFERTSFSKIHLGLTCFKQSSTSDLLDTENNVQNDFDMPKKSNNDKNKKIQLPNKRNNDSGRTKKTALKVVLGDVLGYGPALSEHIILDSGLSPNMKIGDEDNRIDEKTIGLLSQYVSKFEDWLTDVISGDIVPEGYILMQSRVPGKEKLPIPNENSDQVYDEFCPILLNQFKTREFVKLETFDAALDEFYSKIESQRAEQQLKAKEGTALQKLNKIKLDQENRVHTLKKEVDRCTRMAQLIEYNLADVDSAILAVRVALANGMDWEDLARMVKEEKKAGNPIAGLIDRLHLEKNSISLLLSNNLDEMDEDQKTLPVDKVEVDLSLSAHANARRWYEMKKRQESKEEKTIMAHEKAFKAAERKTRLQLTQEKSVATISHMRKVHWFEKFNWFISSENYLVISGRDAQQNEMIVKRYMSKGDIYVHADLHGASSGVIKNHKPENPVPPLTLNQAGCFTVCYSQAWDSKMVTSAWWVYPHQVSKTAPTGEYLTVGSFMIRGKKNFLPPHPLVMGFGLLFRLDESSLGSHLNERRIRGEEEGFHGIDEHSSHTEEIISDNTESDGEINDGETKKNVTSNFLSDSYQLKQSESNAPSISPELEVLMDKVLELGTLEHSVTSYELSAKPSMLTEIDEFTEKKTNMRDKPYISKAERKNLKKGEKNGGQRENDAQEIKENNSSSLESRSSSGKMTRGQKGKLKKIKEKYAEQDDEERKIRMALLASAGEKKKLQGKNGASIKEIQPNAGQDDSTKICYKCKKVGHLSRDCPEHLEVIDGSKVVVRKDTSIDILGAFPSSDSSKSTRNEDKVITEDDDLNEINEEEKAKLIDVDYLTGNPLANDILLYAVPVCGPYNAVQTYKYRVKITPGTAKRGKAAKTAMNLFSHMPEATNREKELIKACVDPELVAAIIGNAKITAAGLTQLKQKQKKGKKNSSKEGK